MDAKIEKMKVIRSDSASDQRGQSLSLLRAINKKPA